LEEHNKAIKKVSNKNALNEAKGSRSTRLFQYNSRLRISLNKKTYIILDMWSFFAYLTACTKWVLS
jgi:hypothetical protein